jgi:hypothetical protein
MGPMCLTASPSCAYRQVEIGNVLSFVRTSSTSTGVIARFWSRSLMHRGAHPGGQLGFWAVGVWQAMIPHPSLHEKVKGFTEGTMPDLKHISNGEVATLWRWLHTIHSGATK